MHIYGLEMQCLTILKQIPVFFQKKLSVKNKKFNVVTDITKQSSYLELNLKK